MGRSTYHQLVLNWNHILTPSSFKIIIQSYLKKKKGRSIKLLIIRISTWYIMLRFCGRRVWFPNVLARPATHSRSFPSLNKTSPYLVTSFIWPKFKGYHSPSTWFLNVYVILVPWLSRGATSRLYYFFCFCAQSFHW